MSVANVQTGSMMFNEIHTKESNQSSEGQKLKMNQG